jgi:hypothetical protein
VPPAAEPPVRMVERSLSQSNSAVTPCMRRPATAGGPEYDYSNGWGAPLSGFARARYASKNPSFFQFYAGFPRAPSSSILPAWLSPPINIRLSTPVSGVRSVVPPFRDSGLPETPPESQHRTLEPRRSTTPSESHRSAILARNPFPFTSMQNKELKAAYFHIVAQKIRGG